LGSSALVVGLDIGSTKVCAVIGERTESGSLEITGVGESESTGMRKGVVVNIEATIQSIAQAVEAAEIMSGREVKACWTGIGGNHIEGMNTNGMVTVVDKVVGKKDRTVREISQDDVDRVLEIAKSITISMDRQVLEVIPQMYIVDNQRGILNPLNMIGVRLEAVVYILTCSMTIAKNLVKCVNRAGFMVNNLILQTLAAGRAVLTVEEKDLGVALVDLGGGTTDVLVYVQGVPYSTFSVPLGGAQVTKDISLVLGIPMETAEEQKKSAGCCLEELLDGTDDGGLTIPGMAGRPPVEVARSELAAVIQPRMEEIFSMVKKELDRLSPDKPLAGGIVLTGGGAELTGTAELASRVFRMPARIGSPLSMGSLGSEYQRPAYATAVGLALEGNEREGAPAQREGHHQSDEPSWISKLWHWIKTELF